MIPLMQTAKTLSLKTDLSICDDKLDGGSTVTCCVFAPSFMSLSKHYSRIAVIFYPREWTIDDYEKAYLLGRKLCESDPKYMRQAKDWVRRMHHD